MSLNNLRFFRLVICTAWFAVVQQTVLLGQAGLREALERLDRDKDGEVEPEEITPLARPYLERIMKSSRLSIYRDNDVEELLRAARRYYATQNGVSDDRVEVEPQMQVRSFGPDPNQPLVPEFGLAEVKYPYIQADLDLADRMIRTRDRDGDGMIDRKEASYERWTHRDPFEEDLNGDDRLSRLELAQRYARRRALDQVSDELRQKAWRTYQSGNDTPRRREEDSSSWWRRGGNSFWLAATIISRFDVNRNGRLEVQEAKELGMPVGQIDINRDGELSRDEMFAYLEPIQKEVGEMTEGIPGWFFELDSNQDGQIAMSEFMTEWNEEKMAEFESFDLNQDALLTMNEILRSKNLMGGSFAQRTAEILPPGKTIISEIEISDDILIADLNVEISITHTYVSYLDGFLTGPDGQRIELFSSVGGSDDNFNGTTFDDQASYPINKARSPFEGSFQPMALVKRQPSLGHYNGKNAKGTWQLVIRGSRSDRFGMLHYWGLNIRPEEKLPGQTLDVLEAPAEEGEAEVAEGQSRDESPEKDAGKSPR
jgi:subtilisin-like proprotein convertase family protein/Ca2+-binding EF-hand superfamily protein